MLNSLFGVSVMKFVMNHDTATAESVCQLANNESASIEFRNFSSAPTTNVFFLFYCWENQLDVAVNKRLMKDRLVIPLVGNRLTR